MAEERAQRRLAAVLAADVVGYSRLMEQDEAGTLALLKSRRTAVLEPLVAKHQGRIFKITGDGVLVEFGSAVNAVQCAIDLQQDMATANLGQADGRHIVLRIGVNLGDVIVEGSDLYGDGVNVSARLEAMCQPGGIIVSGTTYDYVRNKIKIGFDDLGPQTLKNLAEPVRAFRVTGTPAVAMPAAFPAADKPCIAVLPFTNLSGDMEQEYFSDGLTEDIITELSRFRALLVVARNSSFTFKGQAVDVKDVGRRLGCRYVVEGSVRKIGDRVRITAQLLEASTGNHLWAERYDRNIEDIHGVQDEITRSIVTNLPMHIEEAERTRVLDRTKSSFTAYDHWLRGKHYLNKRGTKDDVMEARRHLERAIEIDPTYAAAYVDLADTYYAEYNSPWASSRDVLAEQIFELSRRAVELDPRDSRTHLELAWGYLHVKHDFELAKIQADEAMALNPNDYYNYCFVGWLAACSGNLDHAVACSNEALRRSPLVSDGCLHTRVVAEYLAGNYQEAVSAFGRMRRPDRVVHGWVAAAYGQLNRHREAHAMAEEFLKQVRNLPWAPKQSDAAEWRSFWNEEFLAKDSAARDHLFDGLRKAGLPI
jgi:TolB-like protein/Tfp pilus assembly protein PilF